MDEDMVPFTLLLVAFSLVGFLARGLVFNGHGMHV
jgi:hypothetical protein